MAAVQAAHIQNRARLFDEETKLDEDVFANFADADHLAAESEANAASELEPAENVWSGNPYYPTATNGMNGSGDPYAPLTN